LDTPINNGNDDGEYINNGLFDDFNKNNAPVYMRNRRDLADMFKSLEGDLSKRKRFDFVVGNPPYIGLNKCGDLPFTELMKKKELISMGSVYGVNLHSIPNNHKKYPPKPNLYAFFIALGFALLKDKGKICYIVPQNILSAGDLDVIRYYLAKKSTIEKIITFSNPMFTGRGLKQKADITTSSLVFVAVKEPPQKNHKVEVINYNHYNEKKAANFEVYFKSRNKTRVSVLQQDLCEKVENWSFVQQDTSFLEINKLYISNTNSMEIYFEHKLAKSVLKCNFWFDVGFILNKKYFTDNSTNAYPILDFQQSKGYSLFTFDKYYPKNTQKISLTKNSQGYGGLGHKYYIVWRIKNFQQFHFTEIPVIFNMGKAAFISSDNKNEMLYLFALLNAPVNISILIKNLKKENEKEFLVAIKSIKKYIRVPKITSGNKNIKNEIIKQTETMLDMEKPVINDYVDFPRTAMQTFDFVSVEGDSFILTAGDRNYTAKISKGKAEQVKSAIEEKYFAKTPLVPNGDINIEELKFLPVIDYGEQKKLKNYIDDLVFALYFDLPLSDLGFVNTASVHNCAARNELYSLVNSIK